MVFLISLCLALIFILVCGDSLKKNPVPFYIGTFAISFLSIFAAWSDMAMPALIENWIIPIVAGGGLTGAFFAIVMYAGAFPNRSLGAKTFIPLRGPLSIIASINGLGHSVAYGLSYYKKALNGFSELSTSLIIFIVLSTIMTLIMIPLFITSFVSVRRKMKAVTWKKLQRMAYIFYALLFVHVMMLMVPPALKGSKGYDITVFVYVFIYLSYLVCRLAKATGATAEKLPRKQMVLVSLSLLVATSTVAVINANIEKPEEKPDEKLASEKIEQTTDLSATNTLKDGTFTGEGMGNNGTIAVEVTITGGEISDIVFTKFSDDAEYFDVEKDGKEMIDQVLQAQSADVDTIAGATYSSEGFLAAVKDALKQAGQ
ncbi:FMN-binding protein [Pseudobutyrivibrio xylanivorans]|uniref:DMSO/TMAO reductase YedYZ, heme-binding membrane subunit n=1 Tax=Pseudobutyrivibrio xylanivorans DSM 14809 TaxID=1123012 RepID=A0A1M6HG19_PSEXY|nr:FMN-binding protein [Pseudobutyrivibrio xylanivorans]SHJ21158.1 DMSO/TMAO reductase YedYZ, heme-binding membrane subunit [Pseudobutyrivibrio xylanivorans DSM 14809]